MQTCPTYEALPQEAKDQIDSLISRMRGKSHVADILIQKSDLSSYVFKITVQKYNTVRGWATIGYVRHDVFKGNTWRLTYQPRRRKGEVKEAGKTPAYS